MYYLTHACREKRVGLNERCKLAHPRIPNILKLAHPRIPNILKLAQIRAPPRVPRRNLWMAAFVDANEMAAHWLEMEMIRDGNA